MIAARVTLAALALVAVYFAATTEIGRGLTVMFALIIAFMLCVFAVPAFLVWLWEKAFP